MQLFKELQRRNVFRVAIGYIVSSWLLAQVADLVLENTAAPDWIMQVIMLVLALGFPVVVFFSWAYEVTPEGIKRESEIDRAESITYITGRKFDRAIVALLIVALGYFAFDKYILDHARDAELMEATPVVNEPAVDSIDTPQETDSDKTVIDQSIAVLPFVNMSSDPEQEYFSDGISEELLNLLTKIPQLKVIARTSSFAFKGKDVPIAEIAETLNVAYVLEGSVRKSGDRVRITAQLIRASDSTHLWSESYDRTLEDIFAVQDEIAATVVAQLKVKLLGELPRVQTTDPKAYALLLKARQVYSYGTPESLEQTITLMQEAAAIDPESSLVWGELARAFAARSGRVFQHRETSALHARDAARRALAIDPDSALAENALGIAARWAGLDLAAAARHFERALSLEPANPRVLRTAGELINILGRVDDAIAIQKFVVSRDPLNPWGYLYLGAAYFEAGRLDEGIASLRIARQLSPGFVLTQLYIGLVLMKKGEHEAALESIKLESIEPFRLAGLSIVYHTLGNTAESDAALNEVIAKYEQQMPAIIAQALAYRGEIDRAFEWLEKAVKYRDPGLVEGGLISLNWSLVSSIQEDPRWLPFLERNGISPAQLDAIEFNVTLPE